jgi:dihydroorotase-like cyclic amidohydrolase
MLRLPGLIDVHVHMREPGTLYKEDWDSGTAAALAGGFTAVMAMPNTNPPIFDAESLGQVLETARQKARCDYAQYLGAGPDNASTVAPLASQAAGLKMYLDMTYGQLRLDEMILWQPHFENYPATSPLVVHAEGRTMAAAILFAALYDRPLHIAHVSLGEEILIIKKAKQQGIKVTCEVAPHHLFLNTNHIPSLGDGRSEVRPRLAGPEDQATLWANLDVIDCFATDHAPHTVQEKDGDSPPPGFPGLETALPLFLTAVNEGRLSLDDLINRLYFNPKRIFALPNQPDTWVEVDPDAKWVIHGDELHSRCGWTPFEGFQVSGRVRKVFLRGREVFRDGQVLAEPGFGNNLRSYSR